MTTAAAVTVTGHNGHATLTLLGLVAGVLPIPVATCCMNAEAAHELARRLGDAVGPDPVTEHRVQIEVADRVAAVVAEVDERVRRGKLEVLYQVAEAILDGPVPSGWNVRAWSYLAGSDAALDRIRAAQAVLAGEQP